MNILIKVSSFYQILKLESSMIPRIRICWVFPHIQRSPFCGVGFQNSRKSEMTKSHHVSNLHLKLHGCRNLTYSKYTCKIGDKRIQTIYISNIVFSVYMFLMFEMQWCLEFGCFGYISNSKGLLLAEWDLKTAKVLRWPRLTKFRICIWIHLDVEAWETPNILAKSRTHEP